MVFEQGDLGSDDVSGGYRSGRKGKQDPVPTLTNNQLSKWVFKKGNAVFLLRATEGKVYVMQAYTTVEDPSLTYEQLPCRLDPKLYSTAKV